MTNLPLQRLSHLIKQYEIAFNQLNLTRAYEIAVDISDIALQLEQFAQNLANENNT